MQNGNAMLHLVCAGNFEYGNAKAVKFAFANVLITVLVRQATLIRVLYFVLLHTVCYRWVPLVSKNSAVSFLVHIWGLHNGSALSRVIWRTYAIVRLCQRSNTTALWLIAALAVPLQMPLMLITALGDFTRGLIDYPPTYLWTRLFRNTAISYMRPIYNSLVTIDTGTGVGVVISTLLQRQDLNFLLIWIGEDLRQTFGDQVVDLVCKWPAHKLQIIDVRMDPRPNIPELAVTRCQEWKAQAVFVGSNQPTTQSTVVHCHLHGISACGPIWDF